MTNFRLGAIALFGLGCVSLGSADAAETSSRNKRVTNKKIHLYVAGDIADCRKRPASESMAMRTADLIAQQLQQDKVNDKASTKSNTKAELKSETQSYVLTLGDNTYPIGNPDEFSDCYEPSWGQFKKLTLPSPGNHDYGVPKALGYFNYFGDLAGPERRGYYAKRVGNWLLLSLNSNIDGNAMQAQMSWLKQQLDQSKASCTLAFWHHPVFSSGGHGNNDIMLPAWKLLVQAKADLVLASHDHHYERFAAINGENQRDDKAGIVSFVVGTGGAKLSPMFLQKEHSQISDNNTHGVLKLVLKEKSYEWEFLPVEGQKLKDKGNGLCH